MVSFIDMHRAEHGVEPICTVLPIAPSTYYEHLAQRADPARLSDRARRDAALRPEILRVFEENWRVYGVRKIWRQLQREGFTVARCTVARLMKSMGIQGIIRGKPHKNHGARQKGPVPAGQGKPAIPCTRAQHALGQRFHRCRHLERVRLCRLRYRCLCPQDRWLACQHLGACRVHSRRPGTGCSRAAADKGDGACSSLRPRQPRRTQTVVATVPNWRL